MIAQAKDAESAFSAAARDWDERYGDSIRQVRRWRIAAIASLTFTTLLALITVVLAGQAQRVSYVVKVDQLGASIGVSRADVLAPPDESTLQAQLANWITDARSVSSDPVLENKMLARVYARIASSAKPYLDDWYRSHSPLGGAGSTIAVTINGVVPQGAMTYQVQWTEEQRARDGSNPQTTRWEAQIAVGLVPPADAVTIRRNPLGVYVTQLSWTQRL